MLISGLPDIRLDIRKLDIQFFNIRILDTEPDIQSILRIKLPEKSEEADGHDLRVSGHLGQAQVNQGTNHNEKVKSIPGIREIVLESGIQEYN